MSLFFALIAKAIFGILGLTVTGDILRRLYKLLRLPSGEKPWGTICILLLAFYVTARIVWWLNIDYFQKIEDLIVSLGIENQACWTRTCTINANYASASERWKDLIKNYRLGTSSDRQNLYVAVNKISSADKASLSPEQNHKVEIWRVFIDGIKENSPDVWQRIAMQHLDDELTPLVEYEFEESSYKLAISCVKSCGGEKCISDFEKKFSASNKLDALRKVEPSAQCSAPPPDPELPRSDARLAALRLAAERWRNRTGPVFQDFSQAKNSINQYDKDRFTTDDSTNFDILNSAEYLIKWREKGLDDSTKGELPIYIHVSHSNTVDDRLSIDLQQSLKEKGFNIVEDILKAALFVEFDESKETTPILNQLKNQWQATTSFTLKLTWIGGAKMIPDITQLITELGEDDEGVYNASFKAASEIALDNLLALTHSRH